MIHKVEVTSANPLKTPCNQVMIIAVDTGQLLCCTLHPTLTDLQPNEKERMCQALKVPMPSAG